MSNDDIIQKARSVVANYNNFPAGSFVHQVRTLDEGVRTLAAAANALQRVELERQSTMAANEKLRQKVARYEASLMAIETTVDSSKTKKDMIASIQNILEKVRD